MIVNSLSHFIQSTIALIFAAVLGVSGVADGVHFKDGAMVIEQSEGWGVAFGGIAFTGKGYEPHELGHLAQERMLKALFLPIIGIPSLISATIAPEGHEALWFERWADELGQQ